MRTIAEPSELRKAVADFIERLQKGIRIEAVILYGSYAQGAPHEWSDVDIAVISPDFEGLSLSKRQEILSRLSLGRYPRLAPIGYPSSEYDDPAPASFLREIIRTGRVVWQEQP